MIDRDDFDLSQEIDRHATHLAHDVRSRRRREEVRQEYKEHLEDAVYAYMLQGLDEREAWRRACDDLGDSSRVQMLLALVHNKDPLPQWVKYPLALLVLTSYFYIPNESFRSWYIFLLQIGSVVGIYYLILFFRAINIRRIALKKIRAYARQNGHTLRISHPYRSLIYRTTSPELIYETEERRYIISLFSTIRLRKTLHLSEHGVYNYSAKKGYGMMFVGRPHMKAAMDPDWLRPKNIRVRKVFHTDLSDVSLGMHAMPNVRYEDYHSPDKQNVDALVLNPIPFDVDYLQNGQVVKVRDDALMANVRLWSASGFLSYIEGERIKKRK